MLDETKPLGPNLASYFEEIKDGHLSGMQATGLNLLDHPEAIKISQKMGCHPVLATMGGLVLDDAGTSNHHILITKGPLIGSIFFLDHDGDSRVVYESLQSFLVAANSARSRHIGFEQLHPSTTPTCPYARALDTLVISLLDSDEEDLIPSLVPSMDLENITLLERLATSMNFYLGEAVAQAICLRPSEALRTIAILCADHPHSQVVNAGRAALQVLDANSQTLR